MFGIHVHSGDMSIIAWKPPTIQIWLTGLAYFLLAALTVSFTRFDGGAAFIWLSSGVLLAQLCVLPIRQWFAGLLPASIAVLVMTSAFGLGAKAAPGMLLANLSEPLAAALCLRWFRGAGFRIDTIGAVASFLLGAGILGPALSGLIGAAEIRIVTGASFSLNWLHWFAAHSLGTTLSTPLAFVVLSGEARRWTLDSRWRNAPSALSLFLVALTSYLVFCQHSLPLLFLPFLPMTLATICAGRLGAIGSCVMLAAIGGIFTAHGAGPVNLIEASAGTRAIFLQAYIGCGALLVLPVAALLRQHHDLTERLALSEARYRAIADSLGDAVVDVTLDGVIRYASPTIAQMTGMAPERLIGREAKSIVLPEDLAEVWNAHEQAIAYPGQTFGAQYRGPGAGPTRWFEVMIRAVQAPSGAPLGVVGSIRDITSRKEAEMHLGMVARTDPLTGVLNRRAFEEIMVSRLATLPSKPCAVSLALFDLDHFKSVNDTYGHAAGDDVLRAVAEATRLQLRAEDVLARIGGEEFAIVFWNLERSQAEIAARRLQASIHELAISVGGSGVLRMTASMGLAELRTGETLSALLQRSDTAMYEAKHAGRNCLRLAA